MAYDLCKINGVVFDVPISELTETLNVLDGENAGRAISGRMIRDVIGTYIGHKVTFFNGKDNNEYDRLCAYLKEHSVDESVIVDVAHEQTTISYEAYYTTIEKKIRKRENDVNYWDAVQVSFVPMDAQVKP